MPVECAIQMPRDSKDWVKKTSEVYSRKNLQAGEYEVFGRFEGRTLKETVTLKAGKTQTVVFNFLVRDLSEIPADSPAQQALEQLNQAKLYHVENRIAQAWQAIQQAKTLYTDDPEIQSVYQKSTPNATEKSTPSGSHSKKLSKLKTPSRYSHPWRKCKSSRPTIPVPDKSVTNWVLNSTPWA